jgi:hypothetical protein
MSIRMYMFWIDYNNSQTWNMFYFFYFEMYTSHNHHSSDVTLRSVKFIPTYIYISTHVIIRIYIYKFCSCKLFALVGHSTLWGWSIDTWYHIVQVFVNWDQSRVMIASGEYGHVYQRSFPKISWLKANKHVP